MLMWRVAPAISVPVLFNVRWHGVKCAPKLVPTPPNTSAAYVPRIQIMMESVVFHPTIPPIPLRLHQPGPRPVGREIEAIFLSRLSTPPEVSSSSDTSSISVGGFNIHVLAQNRRGPSSSPPLDVLVVTQSGMGSPLESTPLHLGVAYGERVDAPVASRSACGEPSHSRWVKWHRRRFATSCSHFMKMISLQNLFVSQWILVGRFGRRCMHIFRARCPCSPADQGKGCWRRFSF